MGVRICSRLFVYVHFVGPLPAWGHAAPGGAGPPRPPPRLPGPSVGLCLAAPCVVRGGPSSAGFSSHEGPRGIKGPAKGWSGARKFKNVEISKTSKIQKCRKFKIFENVFLCIWCSRAFFSREVDLCSPMCPAYFR